MAASADGGPLESSSPTPGQTAAIPPTADASAPPATDAPAAAAPGAPPASPASPASTKPPGRVGRRIHYVVEAVIAIAVGVALATIVATVIVVIQANHMMTVENGWAAFLTYDEGHENFLDRAAISYVQPLTNSPAEAVYWQGTVDGNMKPLNGANNYVLHFAAGQLPPNDAFWSLTLTNPKGQMVANPARIYSVSSHSGLQANPDGSVDIYIQNTAPSGHESNWLPSPDGPFKLWLRIYQPAQSILDGQYQMPPVTEVN